MGGREREGGRKKTGRELHRKGVRRGKWDKIRYGERQEKVSEGQENKWRYGAPEGGKWGESLVSLRDLG